MAINFADKAVFGLAAVPIMAELHLSPGQFGAIGSSFFALFSISAAFIGWLGDRVQARWLLAVMAVLWSAAQAPLAGVVSVGILIACRILLGASEGPAYPTALHDAFERFAEKERTLVSGLLLSGVPFGIAAAGVGFTWIMARWGWHGAFAVSAALSLVWAAGWIAFVWREKAGDSPKPVQGLEARLSLRDVLAVPTMIGVMIASFASYAANAVAVIWFPAFLERAEHFSAQRTGWLLGFAWIIQIPICILGGFIAESMQRRGIPTRISLGVVGTTGLALTGAAFVGLGFANSSGLIAVLVVAGLISSLVLFIVAGPLVAEIAPVAKRSSAFGMLVAVYAVAGLLGPFLVGMIIQASKSPQSGYHMAFLYCGMALVAAAFSALLLIRPEADRARLALGVAR